MKVSADKFIQKVYPEIKLGAEWSAVKAAQEAECKQLIKDIIGIAQTNRTGLGSMSKRYFPKWTQREKETWWVKKSGCLRKSKEQPVLLLRPNNVLG